jgi:hypothetical protein
LLPITVAAGSLISVLKSWEDKGDKKNATFFLMLYAS